MQEERAAATQRVFLALWPDAAVRGKLAVLAERCAAQCGGREVAARNLHLTLVFLGALSPAQIMAVCACAARLSVTPFTLELDRVGYWPRPGIVWAGCRETPAPLALLVQSLHAELGALGFALESRPFQVHVTLARKARRAPTPAVSPLAWPVAGFCLVSSRFARGGSEYAILARWP